MRQEARRSPRASARALLRLKTRPLPFAWHLWVRDRLLWSHLGVVPARGGVLLRGAAQTKLRKSVCTSDGTSAPGRGNVLSFGSSAPEGLGLSDSPAAHQLLSSGSIWSRPMRVERDGRVRERGTGTRRLSSSFGSSAPGGSGSQNPCRLNSTPPRYGAGRRAGGRRAALLHGGMSRARAERQPGLGGRAVALAPRAHLRAAPPQLPVLPAHGAAALAA